MSVLARLIAWPFTLAVFLMFLPFSLVVPKDSGCRYRHDYMKWMLFIGRKPYPPRYDPCGSCGAW